MHVFHSVLRLGKNTPIEIRRAGKAAHRNSAMLGVLMEQWTQCEGVWTASELLLQIREKKKNRKYGCRKWLCRSELENKYGSKVVASQIIEAKMNDEEASKSQVRCHPDLHGLDTDDSWWLFWGG